MALLVCLPRCGSGVVPVLLSEVSSPKTRGAVGSIHQLMINLGILCSGVLGYVLVNDVAHGWRYVQAFIAVPAVAQVCPKAMFVLLVGVLVLPCVCLDFVRCV